MLLLSSLACILRKLAILDILFGDGLLVVHCLTLVAAHRCDPGSISHVLGDFFVVDECHADQLGLSIDFSRLRQRVSGVLNYSLEQSFVELAPVVELGRHQGHHILVPVPQI